MVVLDHGQGLISSYLHLSKSLVEKGDMVEKGAVFCMVGKSGRVTGAASAFFHDYQQSESGALGLFETEPKMGPADGRPINMAGKKEPNFESNLKRLEEIVTRLEGDELSLEDSLKLFEEGVKAGRFLRQAPG